MTNVLGSSFVQYGKVRGETFSSLCSIELTVNAYFIPKPLIAITSGKIACHPHVMRDLYGIFYMLQQQTNEQFTFNRRTAIYRAFVCAKIENPRAKQRT